jgi:hypothetical protein
MSGKKGEKKKRLKGFAKLLKPEFDKLMEKEEFRKRFEEKFKDSKIIILLNPVDGRYASIIKVIDGTIEFDSVKNKEDKISQKAIGWNAKLETTTEIFMKLAADQLSMASIIWKWIIRKIKVKNYKKILKVFSVLM